MKAAAVVNMSCSSSCIGSTQPASISQSLPMHLLPTSIGFYSNSGQCDGGQMSCCGVCRAYAQHWSACQYQTPLCRMAVMCPERGQTLC